MLFHPPAPQLTGVAATRPGPCVLAAAFEPPLRDMVEVRNQARVHLWFEGKFGEPMGLTNDWAYRIIKHVGNYGEVFERTVGNGSPLKISRGQNALWTTGGLQYAPPIR